MNGRDNSEGRDDHDLHGRTDAPARAIPSCPESVEERVQVIADFMADLLWERGKTGRCFAEAWGYYYDDCFRNELGARGLWIVWVRFCFDDAGCYPCGEGKAPEWFDAANKALDMIEQATKRDTEEQLMAKYG